MKKGVLVLACLFNLILISQSEAFILAPVADATSFDDGNNGTVDFINLGGFPQVLNHNTFNSRALFEFDISSLVSVQNAVLDLDVEASQNPFPFTLGIYTSLGDGVITNNDHSLGSLFTTFDYNGESNLQIDLTSRLTDHVNGGDQFLLINIRKENQSQAQNSPPFVAFNSLEHPRSALLKVNETNAVPEPITCATMGLGLLGAGFLRRRKI